MVMARSSVHRRDDTLDLVQVVPEVDKIILVFTTVIIQEICLLVLTTIVISYCTSISYQVPGSYFSVKSKHVPKIKHGKYQGVCSCT